MADLGDIGKRVATPLARYIALTFAGCKQPAGDLIDIPSSLRVTLLQRGAFVRVAQGHAGHAYFYDLDDGTYTALAEDGSTWSVVVSGSTATVTNTTPVTPPPPYYPPIKLGGRLLVLIGGKITAIVPT